MNWWTQGRDVGGAIAAMDVEGLAAFAHDLRTPMCAVSGAAQMALTAHTGSEVSEQMEQILLAVRTMDGMLERLMGTRTEEACSGATLRQELLTMESGQAAGKGIALSVDFDALHGRTYRVDGGALSRVLINLVGNAIKYTQEGGWVCVRAFEEETHRPWGRTTRLTFIVSDNGMGMKPSFLRRMYMPFSRADESAHLPGKGLGLAIARRLVRQMGGTIAVRSEWGRGTAFTVRIPVCTAGRARHS